MPTGSVMSETGGWPLMRPIACERTAQTLRLQTFSW